MPSRRLRGHVWNREPVLRWEGGGPRPAQPERHTCTGRHPVPVNGALGWTRGHLTVPNPVRRALVLVPSRRLAAGSDLGSRNFRGREAVPPRHLADLKDEASRYGLGLLWEKAMARPDIWEDNAGSRSPSVR